MNTTIINNTLKFLNRVDLKGSEAPALIECIQELNKLARDTDKNVEE